MAHLINLTHLTHLVHLIHLVHLVDLVHLVELLHCRIVVHAGLHCCGRGLRRNTMLLVPATRVGVAVDARVARQLVGSAETLGAARELTGVRLLARVGANVSRLMLQTVEGLVAQRALVGSRQIRAVLVLVLHGAHGGHGHGRAGHRRRCAGGGLRCGLVCGGVAVAIAVAVAVGRGERLRSLRLRTIQQRRDHGM